MNAAVKLGLSTWVANTVGAQYLTMSCRASYRVSHRLSVLSESIMLTYQHLVFISASLALVLPTVSLTVPHPPQAPAKRSVTKDCHWQYGLIALEDDSNDAEPDIWLDRGLGEDGTFGNVIDDSSHACIFRIVFCDGDEDITIMCPVCLSASSIL